jgi:hypothetical protein
MDKPESRRGLPGARKTFDNHAKIRYRKRFFITKFGFLGLRLGRLQYFIKIGPEITKTKKDQILRYTEICKREYS